MPATPLDSAIYRDLLGDPDLGKLFSDTAEIRAMLIVEGALAKVQGDLGLIPETAARAIHRASLEVQIDPAGLSAATGENAVPVPALVEAFRSVMSAPEHAAYLHWGATSQDIMESGLALRLRQALAILEARLGATLAGLADLADHHAALPMTARTYGQAAVPTSFGAVVASWGVPLLALHGEAAPTRAGCLVVSLGGAAGTLSAMDEKGPAVRAALAVALGLSDPGGSRHSTRHGMTGLSAWLTRVTGSLGKMGEDLVLMAQSGIGEISLGRQGASSTMPQKANPVAPALLTAIARQVAGLNSVMQGASLHRQQRDGGAWIAEWMSLPQMILLAGRALSVAHGLATSVRPRADRMGANLDDGMGTAFAERLGFALANRMTRPEAQSVVKAMAGEAVATRRHLRDLALEAYPDIDADLFDPKSALGEAPAEARAFASRVRDLTAT